MTDESLFKGTFYIGPQMLSSTHLSTCHSCYRILFPTFHLLFKTFTLQIDIYVQGHFLYDLRARTHMKYCRQKAYITSFQDGLGKKRLQRLTCPILCLIFLLKFNPQKTLQLHFQLCTYRFFLFAQQSLDLLGFLSKNRYCTVLFMHHSKQH